MLAPKQAMGAMVPAATHWTKPMAAGYGAYARRTKIDKTLHTMETALETVGQCINPVLNSSRNSGRWRPEHGWSD